MVFCAWVTKEAIPHACTFIGEAFSIADIIKETLHNPQERYSLQHGPPSKGILFSMTAIEETFPLGG